uniref:Uncharacterized protein n=1 Tax=Poecilia formosa TaxID=48698 RepID=A0A087Y106_POEFO
VVTILLGAFQLLLCVSLVQSDQMLPKFFFIVPLVLGVVVSTSMMKFLACLISRFSPQLRGCACSNLLGLLGSLLGFGIYIYVFN